MKILVTEEYSSGRWKWDETLSVDEGNKQAAAHYI